MIDTYPETEMFPVFPSRDFAKTIAFYDRLGFRIDLHIPRADGYLILIHGPIELHFFPHADITPTTTAASAYIRTDDVDTLYEIVSPDEHLPKSGIPRFGPPQDRHWGMREFYIVDEDGCLLKFGQQISKP